MADYFWTEHAKYKMKQYGLSEQRVKRVIRAPFRVEEGIVKNTIAVMVPASAKASAGKPASDSEIKPNWRSEIWAMYQVRGAHKLKVKSAKLKAPKSEFSELKLASRQIRVISAWRYPGVSPKNNPIPAEILREIAK